jgi:hypothetical protein
MAVAMVIGADKQICQRQPQGMHNICRLTACMAMEPYTLIVPRDTQAWVSVIMARTAGRPFHTRGMKFGLLTAAGDVSGKGRDIDSDVGLVFSGLTCYHHR